jgi:hypothetical protein
LPAKSPRYVATDPGPNPLWPHLIDRAWLTDGADWPRTPLQIIARRDYVIDSTTAAP